MSEYLRELIKPELLVLIPVLYLIGMALKKAAAFADKHIPLALGIFGVVLAGIYMAATLQFTGYKDVMMAAFMSVTQGILCAGASVYVNQLIKQESKDE